MRKINVWITFMFPFQHKFVDGTGNDPAYTLPAVCRAFQYARPCAVLFMGYKNSKN